MIEFCPMFTSDFRVPEVTCIKTQQLSRALSAEPPPGAPPSPRLAQALACLWISPKKSDTFWIDAEQVYSARMKRGSDGGEKPALNWN